MKILARIDEDGKIVAKIYHTDIEDREGLIEIDDYKEPKQVEGKYYIEYYRDGKIEVEYKDLPESNLDKIKKEYDQKIELLEMALMEVADYTFGGGM